jgi:predicted MFS family arabinose efflux permease
MRDVSRTAAVAMVGVCSFLDLYAPQSILPLLSQEFHRPPAEVSLTISATTLAVALIAPFVGIVADVLGRKRLITAAMFALVIPTIMAARSESLVELIVWRFVQGLMLPPIFAVTVTYIGEEWPADQAIGLTGIYMSASSVGGFFGRFATGVLAQHLNWHVGFYVLAAVTLVAAVGVAVFLPRERRFVRSAGLLASSRMMLQHLRNPQLVATYGVGFAVLFSFVAVFTYVNFYLAAPPFLLSAAALGSIFVVYLAGALVTPLAGVLAARLGRRGLVIAAIGVWLVGLATTLCGNLPGIIAGLAIATCGGFLCQTSATSFVAVNAKAGRSAAVGLYVTFYYIGGSAGGFLPGYVWMWAGWPGCVATVALVLLLMGFMVLRFWNVEPAPRERPGVSA